MSEINHPVFGRHDPELICECNHPRKYHHHMGLSENLTIGTSCNACRCREFKASAEQPKPVEIKSVGKWFLAYEAYNTLTGSFESPEYDEIIQLDSETQESAITEGQSRWKERLSKGTVRYGYSKIEYPRNPRIRFERPIIAD